MLIGGIYMEDKEKKLRQINQQLKALVSGEDDYLANLSNAAALLYNELEKVNWAGFYLMKEGELVLGPFQGLPACIRIKVGNGVCGSAVEDEKTYVVEDVHQFEGHIACDSASESEIVVPLYADERIVGVLDIDSPVKERFDDIDKKYLEEFAKIISKESKFQMDALESLKSRRSVRSFKDKKVEDEKIIEMIDAARLAPSGKNIQPVEYLIIQDEKKRKEITEIASGGDFIAEAPLCIAVISKKCEHDIEDGSAATENILISAKTQGLDSCWVAGYKKDYSSGIEEYFSLPEDYRLISLLAIGYSNKDPEPPAKKSIEEVIHYENFDLEREV